MDLLVGIVSEVMSKDVQTPNAKGSGRRGRRAIQTSSTKNAVPPPPRRRIVARRGHIATSTKCGHWYWNGRHLVPVQPIWYRTRRFGTGPDSLVLENFFWYLKNIEPG
jgi:hypothetical protein